MKTAVRCNIISDLRLDNVSPWPVGHPGLTARNSCERHGGAISILVAVATANAASGEAAVVCDAERK